MLLLSFLLNHDFLNPHSSNNIHVTTVPLQPSPFHFIAIVKQNVPITINFYNLRLAISTHSSNNTYSLQLLLTFTLPSHPTHQTVPPHN